MKILEEMGGHMLFLKVNFRIEDQEAIQYL